MKCVTIVYQVNRQALTPRRSIARSWLGVVHIHKHGAAHHAVGIVVPTAAFILQRRKHRHMHITRISHASPASDLSIRVEPPSLSPVSLTVCLCPSTLVSPHRSLFNKIARGENHALDVANTSCHVTRKLGSPRSTWCSSWRPVKEAGHCCWGHRAWHLNCAPAPNRLRSANQNVYQTWTSFFGFHIEPQQRVERLDQSCIHYSRSYTKAKWK